jgi:hypothetical protein
VNFSNAVFAVQQVKFRKLLDINESLGGEVNIISPTRELVKEGKMVRISARNGDQIDRYVFLVGYHHEYI